MRSYGCKLCSNDGINNGATSNIVTQSGPGTGDCYVLGLRASWTLVADLAAPRTLPSGSFSTFVQCNFKDLKGWFPSPTLGDDSAHREEQC